MAFTSYATVTDIQSYVPQALPDLWENDPESAQDALTRGARNINERLKGLDRIVTVPVAVEPDGSYAEILIRLNVYEAVWLAVSGLYAGEAFDEQWAWLIVHIRDAWTGIEKGKFQFGDEVSTSSESVMVRTQRVSY